MTAPSDPFDDAENETAVPSGKGVANPAKGVELLLDQLSNEAIRGLVEEYITREGTDYGYRNPRLGNAADPHAEWSLDEKVAQVLGQLESGEARIVFDIEQESASIVPADALAEHLSGADQSQN